MIRLDSWLVEKCTKFSYWLQSTTGHTNYSVCKVGLFLAFMGLSGEFSILVRMGEWFGCFIDLIMFVVIADYLHEVEKNEKRLFSGQTLASIGRFPVWLRIWWLICFVIDIIDVLLRRPDLRLLSYLAVSIGLALFAYFFMVVPRPPGKTKVREWLKSIRDRKVLVPAMNEN